eukprot:EG_transcript_14038
MPKVLCYGSGLTQAIFALALKKCNGKVPQTLLRNPKLPWVHERSGDPGYIVLTPPLVLALEELGVWSKLAEKVAPIHHVHYYDCRTDDHYGTFHMSQLCDGRIFKLLSFLSPQRQQLRDVLNKGFWTVPLGDLKEVVAKELDGSEVNQIDGEVQEFTTTQGAESSMVAKVKCINGEEQVVPFQHLVISQYHCPLPKDLPQDPQPSTTNALFRPVRRVPRSMMWDFHTSTDVVLEQPPATERDWARFRNSEDCILELWDKDQTRIVSSIRRTSRDPNGPVGVRVTLRQQLANMLEFSLAKDGWNQVGTLTQFIQATDFASEALKCIWTYIVKTYDSVQQRAAMKYELLKRQVESKDGRAQRLIEKQGARDFLFADTHLSRDWIYNTVRRDTLPAYIVPICAANHSFINDTFDLGLNHSIL